MGSGPLIPGTARLFLYLLDVLHVGGIGGDEGIDARDDLLDRLGGELAIVEREEAIELVVVLGVAYRDIVVVLAASYNFV